MGALGAVIDGGIVICRIIGARIVMQANQNIGVSIVGDVHPRLQIVVGVNHPVAVAISSRYIHPAIGSAG